jgi:tRNA(adenine34) deaminase
MPTYYHAAALTLDEIDRALTTYIPDPRYPHDRYVLIAVQEAVAGAREGNFAVGACLIDAAGQVVQRAHNQMFVPYFRSDLHAEMNVMTRFEDRNKNAGSLRRHTLFTSLEPCPMCVVRLITAGVGKVYHAAPDIESGMVRTLNQLTPVWVQLAERLEFAQADCSPLLQELALQAWLVTAEDRQNKVGQR